MQRGQLVKRVAATFVLLWMAATVWAQPDVFRFIALGDMRGSDNGVYDLIVTEIAAACIAEAPELVIVTGDLVSNGTQTQLEHWRTIFMDPLLAQGIQVYPCRGNHDSSITAWNTVFSGAYALPANGPAGEENLTYSVTHKNALFIATDQYLLALRLNQTWLDQVLAANDAPHIFVFGHTPAFAVYHSDCLASYPTNRDVFWDSLGAAGGRLYFCGHDHFYDHARIQDAQRHWIHQYVTGAAGAPLYSWGGTYADPSVEGISHFMNYGYAVIDVNGYDVTVTLKERAAPGSFVATSDTFSYVAPYALPKADFVADVTRAEVNVPVLFMDSSESNVGPIVSWLWDFGDGQTSTEQNPAHSYTEAGPHTVTLTVANAYGNDSITRESYIEVASMPVGSIAALVAMMALVATVARHRRIHSRGKS